MNNNDLLNAWFKTSGRSIRSLSDKEIYRLSYNASPENIGKFRSALIDIIMQLVPDADQYGVSTVLKNVREWQEKCKDYMTYNHTVKMGLHKFLDELVKYLQRF